MYPNPAAGLLMLDFKNADKWLGQEIKIMTVNGQVLLRHTITSKTDKIDISSLGRGLYFIYGTVNGERLSLNFLKL
ncbi:MAG: T9SS type A sorting domain-containing protein [Bacteroidetes bacterium]|nr:T9SS type A sorting domain-containing protein [Bacteroidota bacterium]